MLRGAAKNHARCDRGGGSRRLPVAARHTASREPAQPISPSARAWPRRPSRIPPRTTRSWPTISPGSTRVPAEPFPPQLGLALTRIVVAALWREPASARGVLPHRRRNGRQHRPRADRAGQGTVVQQHRRCRHRARMRAPVRPRRLCHRQACQSLWRGVRGFDRAKPTSWRYRTDPISSFGGIIAFNRPLDAATARSILGRQFVEVLVAPALLPGAAEALADQAQCARAASPARLAAGRTPNASCAAWAAACWCRIAISARIEADALRCVTTREPNAQELRDLAFAWRVCEVREVQCDRLRARRGHRRRRRRPDEPRLLEPHRRHQGRGRRPLGARRRDGLGCLLSLPRWRRHRRAARASRR